MLKLDTNDIFLSLSRWNFLLYLVLKFHGRQKFFQFPGQFIPNQYEGGGLQTLQIHR